MGNPPVEEGMQILIKMAWLDLKDETGRYPSTTEVRMRVESRMKKPQFADYSLPKVRKIQYIIKEARDQWEKRGPAIVEDDLPWSMGSLLQSNIENKSNDYISPITLPSVMALWRLKLVRGEHLTKRQARWASWLMHLCRDLKHLDIWTDLYSIRERFCLLHGKPFDTQDLDSRLVMGTWELATARWTGIVRPKESTEIDIQAFIEASVDATPPGNVHVKGVHPQDEAQNQMVHEYLLESEGHTIEERMKLVESSPLSDVQSVGDAGWIYAYWLIYIMHKEEWKKLPWSKRSDITVRLSEWVSTHPWKIEGPPGSAWLKIEAITQHPSFKPIEILREVGFEE